MVPFSASGTMDVSPSQSDGSISLDETISTSDSLKSLEFECIENHDASAVSFVETETGTGLFLLLINLRLFLSTSFSYFVCLYSLVVLFDHRQLYNLSFILQLKFV